MCVCRSYLSVSFFDCTPSWMCSNLILLYSSRTLSLSSNLTRTQPSIDSGDGSVGSGIGIKDGCKWAVIDQQRSCEPVNHCSSYASNGYRAGKNACSIYFKFVWYFGVSSTQRVQWTIFTTKALDAAESPENTINIPYCCAKITNNSWLHLNLTGLNARPCVHFSLRSPKALGYCFSKSWMKTMRCYRFIFIFDVHVHSFIGRKYVLLCLLHAEVSIKHKWPAHPN